MEIARMACGSTENKTELTTVNTVADSQSIVKSEFNNIQNNSNKIKISIPDGDIVIAKAAWLVLLENLIMMELWCFVGYYLNKALIKKDDALYALLAALVIIVSAFHYGGGSTLSSDIASWLKSNR